MKRWVLLVSSVFVAIGCGGGGGSSAPSGEGSLKTVGSISVRGFSSSEPKVVGSSGVVSYGFAGVYSSVSHRDTGNSIQDTLLASSKGGDSLWTYDPNFEEGLQIIASGGYSSYKKLQWTNDGKNLYFTAIPTSSSIRNLYLVGTGAPNTPSLVEANVNDMSVSPSGSRLVYVRTNGSGSDVFQCSSSGSGDLLVKNFPSPVNEVAFVREDTIMVRQSGVLTPYKLDGSVYGGGLSSAGAMNSLQVSREAKYYAYTIDVNKVKYGELSPSLYFQFPDEAVFPAEVTYVSSIAFSPDSKTLMASTNNGMYSINMASKNAYRVHDELDDFFGYGEINWQPFGAVTSLVGSSGRFGTGAAGLIYSQRSDYGSGGAFGSLVMMDAVTRASALVTADQLPPEAPYIVYTMTADNINRLGYTAGRQLFFTTPITSASGNTGVVVSIHAQTGRVAALIPFTKTTSYPTPVVSMDGDTLKIKGDLRPFANHAKLFTDPNIKLESVGKGQP